MHTCLKLVILFVKETNLFFFQIFQTQDQNFREISSQTQELGRNVPKALKIGSFVMFALGKIKNALL